jgi:tRNA 2-thiouridine synthesizing protein E
VPYQLQDKTYATDDAGYLIDSSEWSTELARVIAHSEQLEMSDDHWEVINYVRKFYEEFNKSPSIRPLVKYLANELGKEKGNSLYLQILFPNGPAKQATKIAGLPKPKRCL